MNFLDCPQMNLCFKLGQKLTNMRIHNGFPLCCFRVMGSKQDQLKSVLTDAIVELCRREAFYAEELRIEGTVCLVSDR